MASTFLLANYIGGELIAPRDGKYLDVVEPATGKVYARVPNSSREDVNEAVACAQRAFPAWAGLTREERAHYLFKLADAIEDHQNELAEAESRDTGKPISLARRVDIPRAVANFRYFASACQHFASEAHDFDGKALNYTLRQPIGVAACISPWNLPLYLFTWKLAPALAMGNTVVGKPSELTPYTAFQLSELAKEVGFPPGVLNIIHGYGPATGSALIEHPDVPIITFTGGTRTGSEIARIAAPQFKKLSLELGGKNPALVFADCDFERTVAELVRASFTNQGQVCLCASRILVEASLYERFKAAFVAQVQKLRVGDPNDPDTQFGALVGREHHQKVAHYLMQAQQEGGVVLTGGDVPALEGRCEEGYFFLPTVIEGLDQSCKTNQEEIFGPIVTLQPFETDAQAIELANAVKYGLSATVWSENLRRVQRVARSLHAGIVWVNCWMVRDLRTPFGGWKASGVGREGGLEAMRFFTEPKNVCLDEHPDSL